MKVSFFETVRYQAPKPLPSEWPVPSGTYNPDAGARAYRGMIERLECVEALGFDWVSVSEHHYSPRILTPSPIVSAAFLHAHGVAVRDDGTEQRDGRALEVRGGDDGRRR